MSVALFDTNVLLALAWPNHQHHAEAHAWFAARARNGWATCAFTQLGFIRLSSNSAYTPEAVSPQDAALLLRQWTLRKEHRFLPSPAADDSKMVEVARRSSARLVTLDTRVSAHSTDRGLVESIET